MPSIPNLQEADMIARLLATYPRPWTSDIARQSGGKLYSLLMAAFASPDAQIQVGILYAQASTRISTAYGDALDTISVDYFGVNGLPRATAESDSSYRSRILAALLRPRVTRAAIASMIQQLTGYAPRMIEPWNPMDTAAWNEISFWDLDDVTIPFVWGDDGIPWNGFIIAQIPLFSITGGQPVYAWDAGFAWDSPYSYWFDPSIEFNPNIEAELDSNLEQYKAQGTLIWQKVQPPSFQFQAGAITFPQSGHIARQQGVSLLQYMAGGKPAIFVENSPYPASYWLNDDSLNFSVELAVDTVTPVTMAWMALSYLNKYVIHIEVPFGQLSATINPPFSLAGLVPVVMMGWNASVKVTTLTNSQCVLKFNNPSIRHLEVAFLPGGQTAISAGAVGANVHFPNVLPYGFFIRASWDTDIGLVQKVNGGVVLEFSNPCPTGGGTLYWYVQENI